MSETPSIPSPSFANLLSFALSIGNMGANDHCFARSDYDAPQHFNQY